MAQNSIEALVKEMLSVELEKGTTDDETKAPTTVQSNKRASDFTTASTKRNIATNKDTLTANDYPLAKKHPEKVKSFLGKELDRITLDNAMNGTIESGDIKISPEVLEYQAQIAESSGKRQLAENFRRAAELTRIPDDEVLRIYNMLRPNRSTENELNELAQHLRGKYDAPLNAALVQEAADIYKKRGILTDG